MKIPRVSKWRVPITLGECRRVKQRRLLLSPPSVKTVYQIMIFADRICQEGKKEVTVHATNFACKLFITPQRFYVEYVTVPTLVSEWRFLVLDVCQEANHIIPKTAVFYFTGQPRETLLSSTSSKVEVKFCWCTYFHCSITPLPSLTFYPAVLLHVFRCLSPRCAMPPVPCGVMLVLILIIQC